MTTITFDTLKFVEKLKTAGILEAHAKAEAEALVSAFSEAMDSQLANKADINRLERELKGDINRVERELKSDINRPERELLVLKWMVGLVLGGIATLILKAFFPA